MNQKLAAMGVILSASGRESCFSEGQARMFVSILEPYTVGHIEAVSAEHATRFRGWPMSDEALKAFKAMLRVGSAASSPGVVRVLNRTWDVRGDWSGDWSDVPLRSLVWHYGMMAAFPSRCHSGPGGKLAEFRALCLRRGAGGAVLDGAAEAARDSDWRLQRFVAELAFREDL